MHLAIEILILAAIFAGCFFVAVPPPNMRVMESPKPIQRPAWIVIVPRGIMGGNSHDRRLARRRLERARLADQLERAWLADQLERAAKLANA
jgi:hypothetical protein